MYQEIEYQVRDTMAVITLNRPDKMNAWTLHMDREVRQALLAAEEDKAVVAIVITGAGRAFCAGADMGLLQQIITKQEPDLSQLPEFVAPGDADVDEGFRKTYSFISSIQKPVIAAVNGACVGMALPIALYADLRFASPEASFMSAFAQRGLIAEHGCAWMLPRLVGVAHANDILLSSRKIGADEAERMGLVNRVISDQDLLEFCAEYVAGMSAACAPASMARIKKQVYAYLEQELAPAYDESEALMQASFDGADFREGVSAFLQKRKPSFDRLGKE